eukprot:TRINITY_DN10664_c0_g1_i2.p1 TRINITY_DN10664_c0_g1~~TRINITY_DN10664_c0_g1_i2.p1  ORF type:complete len:297 (+),score=70.39 TRINITY_DN10664_c0_g1_i2:84-974(+)
MSSNCATAAASPSVLTVSAWEYFARITAKGAKQLEADRDTDVPTDSDESCGRVKIAGHSRVSSFSSTVSSPSVSLEASPAKVVNPLADASPLYLVSDDSGRVQIVESTTKRWILPAAEAAKANLVPASSVPAIRPPPGLGLEARSMSLTLDAARDEGDAATASEARHAAAPAEQSDASCPSAGSILWTLDARKLHSDSRTIVSPSFSLEVAGKRAQFRVILAAKEAAKAGKPFKRARGLGTMHLKCESGGDFGHPVQIKFSVGTKSLFGPVVHNFDDAGVCSLRGEKEHRPGPCYM